MKSSHAVRRRKVGRIRLNLRRIISSKEPRYLSGISEEEQEERRVWKDTYRNHYDRLTADIGTHGRDELSKTFLELRNHLQLLDALNEKIITLSETLKLTQIRLAQVEQRLTEFEQNPR